MKKVLNAEPLNYSRKAIKNWKFKGYNYTELSWDLIDLIDEDKTVNILIVRLSRVIDDSILKKFPNIESIISATTGLDHLQISKKFKDRVKVITLRDHKEFLNTIPSTAEHTFALMLSLIRNIPKSNEDVKLKNWNRDNFIGYQLKDKKIGIIGMGRTGQKLTKYCKAFGMEVGYYDPYVDINFAKKYSNIEKMYAESDILSFHLHLNDETENYFSFDDLNHIKKGVFIINTSRGKIINEKAVVSGLKEKIIRGVAVDVINSELHDISASALWNAHNQGLNIIITPHLAGATFDAMWSCEEFISNL